MLENILIHKIVQRIEEKKGRNVLALDVRGLSNFTDFFVIADGNVDRHVQALAGDIVELLKEEGVSLSRVEGMSDGQWVVIDAWSVMIHFFTPRMRDLYRLEQLWGEGKLIELPESSQKVAQDVQWVQSR